MNKIINIGLTALFACFMVACENDIDNYDGKHSAWCMFVSPPFLPTFVTS